MVAAVATPPPVRHAGRMMKPVKLGLEEPQEQIIRKIGITLSSKNVKILEKDEYLRIVVAGYRNQHLDRFFEMQVHKRVIDLFSTSEVVKHVTNIQMQAGVEVEVTIADV